jgi:hypothetical protein
MTRVTVTVLATTVLAFPSLVAQASQTDSTSKRVPSPAADSVAAPLFESRELLTLAIDAPLKTIFKDRSQESVEHPGVLSYEDPEGNTVTIPVDIRTRGMTRLQPRICNFPPLRLDLPSTEVAGTLFANQDKIKLVTHCQDKRQEYEQYVLQEYLIYRSYNLVTDLSFRVRLARITYTDTDGERDTLTKYAFLIEDIDMMAARNGWTAIITPGVPPDAMDPVQLSLVEVFQYMIGNTDWSAYMKEPDRTECCHNTKPIGRPEGPVFSVPYDFDITGVVSTRYANRLFRENLERMELRNVRERLYKGRCKSEPHLETTFQLFNAKQEAIYALYRDQADLEQEIQEKSLEYLEDFYEIINDPGKTRREIVRRCRKI